MLTDLEEKAIDEETTKFPTMLTEQERDGIDHEIAKFPERRNACLDALMIVQKHRGYVSDDALVAVAEYLGMSATQLDAIATFYNLIYRKPVGKHVIRLCDSISCHIMDYHSVKQVVGDVLGIDFGQTSTDNLFTLLPAQCLGVCHRAPAMMINDELYQNLDKDKVTAIIHSVRGT